MCEVCTSVGDALGGGDEGVVVGISEGSSEGEALGNGVGEVGVMLAVGTVDG
jgi:hypothetical protein